MGYLSKVHTIRMIRIRLGCYSDSERDNANAENTATLISRRGKGGGKGGPLSHSRNHHHRYRRCHVCGGYGFREISGLSNAEPLLRDRIDDRTRHRLFGSGASSLSINFIEFLVSRIIRTKLVRLDERPLVVDAVGTRRNSSIQF